MRPAAVWHEGIQLILLTVPLVTKCLEITWPKALTRGKLIHRRGPQAHQLDQRLRSTGNMGMVPKTTQGVCRLRALWT